MLSCQSLFGHMENYFQLNFMLLFSGLFNGEDLAVHEASEIEIGW